MHRRITALLAISLVLCAALLAPQAAFASEEGTLDTVYLGSTADVEASDDNDGATAQAQLTLSVALKMRSVPAGRVDCSLPVSGCA